MHVGVIGVGVMGQNHARIYSELKSVDSVSVFDLNEAGAKEVARKTGAETCRNLNDLLEQSDAVSLCVPTKYHFDVAQQIVSYGIPLLIEKPICQTVEEAKKLVSLIPPSMICGVGHIERFNPVVNEILRILDKPLYIEIKRHNPASSRITGTSVVEDLMIHDIDIVFNLLFDKPWTFHSAGNDDLCTALFEFGSIPVFISASRKSSKKIRMIYIEEEDFTIEGDLMTQEIFVHRKPKKYGVENSRYIQDNIIEKVLVNKVEPLKVELSTFIQCVREKRQFPITPAQALKNIEICEAVRMQSGTIGYVTPNKIPVTS